MRIALDDPTPGELQAAVLLLTGHDRRRVGDGIVHVVRGPGARVVLTDVPPETVVVETPPALDAAALEALRGSRVALVPTAHDGTARRTRRAGTHPGEPMTKPMDPDITATQRALAEFPPGTFTAVFWVGLRADGSYAHGVAVPGGWIPQLVRVVGAVLQKVVKQAKVTLQ